MEKLQISVIIPAWNAAAYLPECIAALRRQTLAAQLQILVADDGSTDDTVKLARELGAKVLQLNHGGAAHARNAALGQAEGDYVFFLDADDIPAEDALEKLAAPLLADPTLGAAFSKAKDFISPELTEAERSRLQPRPMAYSGVLPGCSLIRREVFDAVGLFDESLSSGETVAWVMKLRDAGIQTRQLEDVTLLRRLHNNNTGRRDAQGEAANYAAILRARLRKAMAERKSGETP